MLCFYTFAGHWVVIVLPGQKQAMVPGLATETARHSGQFKKKRGVKNEVIQKGNKKIDQKCK